ncbi:MAG TPA: OmpA family protein [Thermoanaerobaculia bacterium]|nr:OmpA family protein [Thermoanaerobaculia bacterium]
MSFSATDHDGARVWPAFTDVLMTVCLILVFYLFAQVVISSQTSAAMTMVAQHQRDLSQAVKQALPPHLRRDVGIAEDGSLQRYTFADWILFDSASAELKPSGMEALAALGRVFGQHAGEFTRIQIEGHTDDQPLRPGARFPSNWELSSARATSVVRFFEDQSRLDPTLLSATGYSEYQPAVREDSEQARARNRRIEVVVVYSVSAVEQASKKEHAPAAAGEGL